jgi:hypothetical protein
MDYYREQYNRLIERASGRRTSGYAETHHIIPRCMGGDDSWQNKVRLWPEEHFIAHVLLKMMHPNNRKICYAIDMMSDYGRMNHEDYGRRQRRQNTNEYWRDANQYSITRDRPDWWFDGYCERLMARIKHPEWFEERTIYDAHEWLAFQATPIEDDRWLITYQDAKGIKRNEEFSSEIAMRIYIDAIACCKHSGRFFVNLWNKFAPDRDADISHGLDLERGGLDTEWEDETEYYWT